MLKILYIIKSWSFGGQMYYETLMVENKTNYFKDDIQGHHQTGIANIFSFLKYPWIGILRRPLNETLITKIIANDIRFFVVN